MRNKSWSEETRITIQIATIALLTTALITALQYGYANNRVYPIVAYDFIVLLIMIIFVWFVAARTRKLNNIRRKRFRIQTSITNNETQIDHFSHIETSNAGRFRRNMQLFALVWVLGVALVFFVGGIQGFLSYGLGGGPYGWAMVELGIIFLILGVVVFAFRRKSSRNKIMDP